MLATYSDAESTALYHYCRSILSQNPFSGGFENLTRLFEMNLTSYEALQQEVQNAHDFNKKNDHTKFKFFLTSFVRLHGYFFSWSIRMHLEHLKGNTELISSQATQTSESTTLLSKLHDTLNSKILRHDREINNEKLQDMTSTILEDFDYLISSGKLTDLHLLRLIAICIFSVHFAELPDAQLLSADSNFSSFLKNSSFSQQSAAVSLPRPQRTIIQSMTLVLLFGIVNR
jgi:hypothetical protein